MSDQPGRFAIVSKASAGTRAAAIGGVVVVLIVGATAAFALLAGEPTLAQHIEKRDALAPGVAYVLGFRGVKSEATCQVLQRAVEAASGDKVAAPRLRAGAAYALGSMMTHDAVLVLAASSANDTDPIVRAAACRSLGHSMETISAAPALLRALDDDDRQVRIAACDGAGLLRDPAPHRSAGRDRGRPGLLRAGERDQALQAITGEKFGIDGADWKHWRETRR